MSLHRWVGRGLPVLRATLELMWIRKAGKVRALALRGGFRQVLNEILLVPELKY